MAAGPAKPDPGPDPGTAREEAERLVATAIGAASMAARRIGRTRGPVSSTPLGEALPGNLGSLADALVDTARSAFGIGHDPAEYRVANASPECCVCPVCRTIAALRDPSPQTAERLTTGAGDLAAGLASFMRAVAGAAEPAPSGSSSSGPPTSGSPASAAGPVAAEPPASAAGPVAAEAGGPGPGVDPSGSEPSDGTGDVWHAATHAPAHKPMAKKAVKPSARPADTLSTDIPSTGAAPTDVPSTNRGDTDR